MLTGQCLCPLQENSSARPDPVTPESIRGMIRGLEPPLFVTDSCIAFIMVRAAQDVPWISIPCADSVLSGAVRRPESVAVERLSLSLRRGWRRPPRRPQDTLALEPSARPSAAALLGYAWLVEQHAEAAAMSGPPPQDDPPSSSGREGPEDTDSAEPDTSREARAQQQQPAPPALNGAQDGTGYRATASIDPHAKHGVRAAFRSESALDLLQLSAKKPLLHRNAEELAEVTQRSSGTDLLSS